MREGVEEDRPQSHFDKASWTEHHATGKRRALWQRPPSVRCQTICSLLIIFVRSVTDRGQFSKVFNDTLGARVARQAAAASVPDSKVQSRDPAGRAWIERDRVFKPPRSIYEQMQTVQGGTLQGARKVGDWMARFGDACAGRSRRRKRGPGGG